MSHNEEVVALLESLKKGKDKEENQATLSQLEELISDGIDEPLLAVFLDAILETKRAIPHNVKQFLLENCLVPRLELSVDVFLRIIGGIGATRVYYEGNRKLKAKKPSKDIQLGLLRWIIDNFGIFEKSLVASGTLVLSVLIKNLAYEFSRSALSQLVVSLLGQSSSGQFRTFYNSEVYHNVKILKDHHIQKVVDLYNKFPLDIYLSELLAFFKLVMPDLDYIAYSPDNYPMLNNLISNPDQVYQWEESAFTPASSKRQKRIVKTSSGDIDTIQALDQINRVNAYKLLRNSFGNDTDAQLLVLLFQTGNPTFISKVNSYVRPNLQSSMQDERDRMAFLRRVARLYQVGSGAIFLESVEDYILTKNLLQNYFFAEMDYRSQVMKYSTHLDPAKLADMMSRDALDLKKVYYSKERIVSSSCVAYVEGVLYLLRMWVSNDDESLVRALNLVLPKLYTFIQYCNPNQEWLTRKVLRFIHEQEENTIDLLHDEALLPPRLLVYTCLLSPDPLIFATACEHIVICKDHSYSEPEWRNLQNSFIMDSVNMLWKERFLKQDLSSSNSSTKGLYLNPELSRKLTSLHLSDQLSVSFLSIGEFFYNPALSYIVTKIIWDIEDKAEDINTRHEGPVSRDSLERLRLDSDKVWLDVSFEELKIKVLQYLDTGNDEKFKGIANLLFNCLKSLSDKRNAF
ncbi:Central kinetochore subunit CTF3 [Candida viswanathii]|uniref:Central kinetochore subunit CTF3 n=1 Tax=Candida viswanathii TaxID=5486 RepID=A0A367XPE3_9ASCO|nr:Central kinetochore subunit CTF3 [Candida viswanathii]